MIAIPRLRFPTQSSKDPVARTTIGTADQAAPFLNKLCLRAGFDHFELRVGSLRIAGTAQAAGLHPLRASAARLFDTLSNPDRIVVRQWHATREAPFRILIKDKPVSLAIPVFCLPLQYGARGQAGAYFLGRAARKANDRRAAVIQSALSSLLEQLHSTGALPPEERSLNPREILCLSGVAEGMSLSETARFCNMTEDETLACLRDIKHRMRTASLAQTLAVTRRYALI